MKKNKCAFHDSINEKKFQRRERMDKGHKIDGLILNKEMAGSQVFSYYYTHFDIFSL